MPSDPGNVDTIAGVRARDDPCDWFLLGHQDDLWDHVAYQVQLRVHCNLSGYSFPKFQPGATNFGLIVGHCVMGKRKLRFGSWRSKANKPTLCTQ